jgi:hypothetical protein
MHSRERLTGTLCRCMVCAEARQKRLRNEALLRKTERYQETEVNLLHANAAKREAEELAAAWRTWQRALLEEVRAEIIAEESGA